MMKNKYNVVAAIIGLVIALDQLTKLLVVKKFFLHETVKVVPGFFNLTYVRNPGAAFGILAGAQAYWRVAFFIVVSCAALAVLALLVRKTEERLPLVAYAFVGGGAVGNLVDRVRFGEVVDFVDWYYKSYHWPAFNVADAAITLGVVLLAVDMLFPQKQETAASDQPRMDRPSHG